MNKFFVLYRVLRKCDSSRSDQTPDGKKRVSVSFVISAVLVLCGMAAAGYAGYLFAGLFELFGGISAVLPALALIIGAVIAFRGMVQLINALYMSADTGLLAAMPVSPVILAGVRLLNVLLRSFWIMAGILVSFGAGYSFSAGLDLFLWIGVCLYAVIVPVFVTLAAAVPVMICMSAFRILRSRNLMKYLAAVGAVIGVIVYMCFDSLSSSGADMIEAAGTVLGFTENYTYFIPVISFITKFMQSGNPVHILTALLLTAAVLVLCVITAGKFYLRGALDMQDTAGSAGDFSGKLLDRTCKARSVRAGCMSRELRMVRRNPVYLLKDFVITFGWPVILALMFAVQILSGSFETDTVEEGPLDFSFTASVFLVLTLTLGLVCGVILFVNMLNDLAYSSITREGKTFSVLKQLPVSFKDLVRAKRDLARNIVGISTIGYLTAGGLIGVLFGVLPWYTVLYGVLTGIPFLYLVVDIDMISGIQNANLHWDNEAAVVKKNAKLILGSYLCIVALLVGLIFFYSFAESHNFPGVPCLLAVPVLLAVLAFLVNRRMYLLAEKKLPEL